MNQQYSHFYGSDIIFHSTMAGKYAAGEFAILSNDAIDTNGGPYPPLFQLILALGALIGKTGFFLMVKTFQYAFYPLMMAVTMFLVYKKMTLRASAWTGIIMLSSIALLDRVGQASPQGLDMILFPLAVYFFLDAKRLQYILSMSLMIYNHGIWAYLHFGALGLFSLIKRKSIQDHLIVFASTLPLFVLTIYYLPGYLRSHGRSHSMQETLATGNLWYLGKYMGLLVLILMGCYLVYLVYNWTQKSKFPYKLSNLEQISFLWILCLTPLFFMIKDRFVSYILPPIAIILAGWIIRTVKSRRVYIPLIIASTIVSMLFSLLAWIIYYQVNNQVFL